MMLFKGAVKGVINILILKCIQGFPINFFFQIENFQLHFPDLFLEVIILIQ